MNPESDLQGLLNQYGEATLPLTRRQEIDSSDARGVLGTPATTLFPGALSPEGAVSGLLLKMGCWDASHRLSQELGTPEGSYWHGIAHRMEPDAANAGYWFRRVGEHPILPTLRDGAAQVLQQLRPPQWRVSAKWNHGNFVEWCDYGRQAPGSVFEQAALAIQDLEWKLLFSWCRSLTE